MAVSFIEEGKSAREWADRRTVMLLPLVLGLSVGSSSASAMCTSTWADAKRSELSVLSSHADPAQHNIKYIAWVLQKDKAAKTLLPVVVA